MTPPAIYDIHEIAPQHAGYYRYPALHGEQLVFVSEEDLWTVPLAGGSARRLTADDGEITSPVFSPDGSRIAYTSTEQGCPEVFAMSARGGGARKLTFSGASRVDVCGWSRDGSYIIFRSNLSETFDKQMALYRVPEQGGEIEKLSIGPAFSFAIDPGSEAAVIVRYADDLAWWKRYRGGTAGQMWIDADGQGHWTRLLPEIKAGICRPMWIDDRIYFITDHSGCANIHSCTAEGRELTQHTDHDGHYARFAYHDGTTVVYSRAGELYRLDTADDTVTTIDIDYPSSRPRLKPQFVDAEEYLDGYDLHPQGHSLAITTRGKLFQFGNWEGAVRQTGQRQGVRYRLARHIEDGQRLVVVSDRGGEEAFEIHDITGDEPVVPIDTGDVDIGRPLEISIAPCGERALFSNHRHQLLWLDLNTGECTEIDASEADEITGFSWAPDSRHVTYGLPIRRKLSVIKIADIESGTTHTITSGEFLDLEPTFDPEGRYLYFLSYRNLEPIVGRQSLDLGFPKPIKPFVIALRKDIRSPFVETPRPLDDDGDGGNKPTPQGKSDQSLSIDFDEITDRIRAFPVAPGDYGQLQATSTRVFWTVFPPASGSTLFDERNDGTLHYYDLDKRSCNEFTDDIHSFCLDRKRQTIALWDGENLQVVSAKKDGPNDDVDRPCRKSGIIDLQRVAPRIERRSEWVQMMREAWRLMRDHFWRADMSGTDWRSIWDRYKSVLPRVSTRIEFSDLVRSMQGELGTSHAYEFGGDYPMPPQDQPGLLGADLRWDPTWEGDDDRHGERGAIRVERILRGDPWDEDSTSPLLGPGLDIEAGDLIVAVNGQRLTRHDSMGELLSHQAGQSVELRVASAGNPTAPRSVTVKTLVDESSLRYREWVTRNRDVVHQVSEGRLGYVHVPNMGLDGYAEFTRQYQSQYQRDGLIVDVRFNTGGFVSQLIIEVLAKKPHGYCVTRRGEPYRYPQHAVRGPVVAITNARAGSDGDIFGHCFKKYGIGPLVGTRSWGGTIGISPQHSLVDNSMTTQPEYAYWFEDIEFGLENHGADPDIDVDIPPETGLEDDDPQLHTAIDVALERLDDARLLQAPTTGA